MTLHLHCAEVSKAPNKLFLGQVHHQQNSGVQSIRLFPLLCQQGQDKTLLMAAHLAQAATPGFWSGNPKPHECPLPMANAIRKHHDQPQFMALQSCALGEGAKGD